jgi:hypothetical protein
METIKITAHTDHTGTLKLEFPTSLPNQEVEVVVVLQPLEVIARDAMGWPVGFFERTYGAFADEPIERPAELPIDVRDSLE